VLNLRWGWNPDHEKLPSLFMQPLTEGGTAGDVPDVEKLLTDYYQARAWDRKTGRPKREKLLELGLDEVAALLHRGASGPLISVNQSGLTSIFRRR
jgi:aldehyde:ferredoxin oxidoreductase